MSSIRHADSVCLQYIWNAIEANPSHSSKPSFQSILSAVQTNWDSKCTAIKLEQELNNAIRDGCIRNADGFYFLVDGFESIRKGGSDWYCFECHGPGYVIPCPTCFRVYHSDCLTAASEAHWACRLPLEDPTVGTNTKVDSHFPPAHSCPVCMRLSRVSGNRTDPTPPQDLRSIFAAALDWIRHRVKWKTMHKVGYLYEPLRNEYLVYRQINTRIISERLRADPSSKEGYPNRTSLLVDLDNLVHNTAVFYGSKHKICNMARQIRSQMKRAMRESAYCVDCYLRPTTLSSIARLTAACRKPHRLLWFQHNGWSFRPCKMLYENNEGYEVVCFGGRHEREFVPRARAFDMNFTAPELGLRMTPSLKKALDEAEEYKANQSAHDRSLPIVCTKSQSCSNLVTNNSKTLHPPSHPLVDSQSVIPTDKVKVLGRKRKVGPKYSSTFGSTDTDSSVSLLSSTPTTVTKRRKSTNEKLVAREYSRNGMISPERSSDDNDDSPSSLDSDSDHSDDTAAFRPSKKSTTGRASQSSAIDSVSIASNGNSQRVVANINKSSEMITNGSSTARAPRVVTKTELYSESSPIPSTLSKPVIRIKPLPLPRSHESAISEQPAKNHSHRVTEPRVKIKPCTSSSSSSAFSVPSCGSTTIPATLSSDGPASSGSVVSSVSSLSVKKRDGRSKRNNLDKLRRKCKQLTGVAESSGSENTLHQSIPKTSNSHSNSSLPRVVNQVPEERYSVSAIYSESTAITTQSPHHLSSLSDSESSRSSLLSPSSSSSSSDISSTSDTSNSTIPSPSRRLSFSNPTMKPSNSFIYDSNHIASAITVSKSIDSCSLNDAAQSHDTAPTLFSTYSSDHNPSPTKQTDSGIPYFQSNEDLSLDRTVSDPLRTSISLRYDSAGVLKSAKKKVPTNQSKVLEYSDFSPRHHLVNMSNGSMSGSQNGYGIKSFGGSKTGNNGLSTTGWSSLTRLSATYGNHTPMTHLTTHPPSGATSNGPTPPSSNSASSSCYSSVSPAALSTTSGLGSSLSDPKSVDASPGEVSALLGNASFSCPGTLSNAIQSDTALFKSIEEQIHRIYTDKLATVTAERDQAREEINRRDSLINKVRREHEAEIKRVKQLTWCQVCLNEAFYHCCPGTAYCSEQCQLQHWTDQHNRDCRRRGESQHLMEQTKR